MREVELGDVAEYQNGYAFKPADWSTNGLPIIRIQNLNDPNKDFNYYAGDEVDEKYYVRNNDILIAWSASLGVYIWDRGDAWLNQHTFKVNFTTDEIDRKYFVYAIENVLKTIESKLHGSTMKHITKTKFLKLKIPLPSLSEQKAIVAKLDRAQRLIDIDKAMLAKYDQLIQSVFLDMFGDPVTNPKGWEVKKLGEILQNKDSKRVPVKASDRKEMLGEYPYYGASGIVDYVDDYLFEGTHLLIGEDGANLISRSTDIAFLASGKYWVNNHAHVLGSESISLLQYVRFFINSIDLKPYVTGSAQPKLNQSNLNKIGVPYPGINHINDFHEKLKLIDNEKRKTSDSVIKSEALFSSLVQEVFG